MSKQKNKKHKTATPKEPITRHDLCARIHALEKENAGLRSDNRMLSLANDVKIAIAERGIKLAKGADETLAVPIRLKDEHRKLNRFLIAALILSGILHLINIFF
jgi:hypothetical protein